VVGARAGGIPDVVQDRETGLLVDPDRPEEIADALVEILSDRALAERLSAGARASADAWIATPEDFAARMEQLLRAVH
jgi:glycosyltransferase involved in cell wall biosynthesis